MKDIPSEERPRERALRSGLSSLSDRELLALFIRHGNAQCSAMEIADEVLKKSQGMVNLASLSLKDFVEIKGINKVKGLELLACIELGRRMSYAQVLKKEVISNMDALLRWLKNELGYLNQEVLMAVYLNIQNEIIHYEILSKGTESQSLVDPKAIFRQGILCHGVKIILVHNHPSGNCKPSIEDLSITSSIKEVGELMGIELLDHIIVGKNQSFSFKQSGLLD